ncbi:MAG: hypothetical protein ACRDRD_15155 [Pseudonocardiaceae bacterium]
MRRNSNDNLGVRDHFALAPTVVADVADPTPGSVGIGGGSGSQHTHSKFASGADYLAVTPSNEPNTTSTATSIAGAGAPDRRAGAHVAVPRVGVNLAQLEHLLGGLPGTPDSEG